VLVSNLPPSRSEATIGLAARNLIKDIKQKIVIDEVTIDEVTSAGFDLKRAEETITSFKTFIEENRDELTALQILYNQPQGRHAPVISMT
jgi:type I restriction enzyme, R subunit